jgi:hypothetical protein
MHARSEALRPGNALQERDELRALRLIDGTQQLGLVLLGYAFEVGEHGAPRRRQVQRMGASVLGVAASFGEATTLEVVDQRHDGAAVDPERDAEGLLGLALGGREVAEHAEVPGVEVDFGEALGEASMRVSPQLHEQEAGTAAQFSRRSRPRAGMIVGHRVEHTAPGELFMI